MNRINTGLAELAEFLSSSIPKKNIAYFRRAVYSFLLLKILFLFPVLEIFYAHVGSYSRHTFIFQPFLQSYIPFMFSFFLFIILLGVFLKRNVMLSIFIFLISASLMSLLYLNTNGGDLLLHFFVLSLVFLNEDEKPSDIKHIISNAAWWMLKINICFLYFINGYGKIFKLNWINGEIMQTIWQLKFYANPHFVGSWFTNPIICLFTAWSVMLFELAFPFLIWFKKPKKYLIGIGILFHILIAVCLSLPDFGLTMMIAYIPFMDFNGNFWTKKRVD